MPEVTNRQCEQPEHKLEYMGDLSGNDSGHGHRPDIDWVRFREIGSTAADRRLCNVATIMSWRTGLIAEPG